MQKQTYNVNGFGKAGPYAHLVEAHGLVFLSGVIPYVPNSDELVTASIEGATRRVLDNIGLLLKTVNLNYSDVVKATIFLQNMGDYAAVNAVYAEYFGESLPARSAVAVAGLPLGVPIEIEVIAARP